MATKFTSSQALHDELIQIMSDEADIVQFAGLLEKVQNLGTASIDKRQSILSDLIFWKAQIEHQAKQIEIKLKKLDAIAYRAAYDKLKLITRPTDSQVRAEIDASPKDEAYLNLEAILQIDQKWATTLSDLYFISQATHKLLGNG